MKRKSASAIKQSISDAKSRPENLNTQTSVVNSFSHNLREVTTSASFCKQIDGRHCATQFCFFLWTPQLVGSHSHGISGIQALAKANFISIYRLSNSLAPLDSRRMTFTTSRLICPNHWVVLRGTSKSFCFRQHKCLNPLIERKRSNKPLKKPPLFKIFEFAKAYAPGANRTAKLKSVIT